MLFDKRFSDRYRGLRAFLPILSDFLILSLPFFLGFPFCYIYIRFIVRELYKVIGSKPR